MSLDAVFSEDLLTAVREVGFPLVGCVDIALSRSELAQHVERYDRWLREGFAGPMQYLVRGRDRRADPTLVLPQAVSVLVVGEPYSKSPPYLVPGAPKHARYLQGEDYHLRIPRKIDAALESVRARYPALTWKTCTDSSAVLERTWGALAGLGWIGKNTLLMHPRYGSYFLIGVALLNLPTGRGPQIHADYCGHCTRCLSACPTQAFVEPHWLDARRCISTLTLETRGPLPDAKLSAKMEGWVAGCDRCQEVCPFNTKPDCEPLADGDGFRIEVDGAVLEAETEAEYKARTRRSALSRVRYADYRRNLGFI